MYHVWKRSDGHVGVSTFMPTTLNSASGAVFTFEELRVFTWWNDVLSFMKGLK